MPHSSTTRSISYAALLLLGAVASATPACFGDIAREPSGGSGDGASVGQGSERSPSGSAAGAAATAPAPSAPTPPTSTAGGSSGSNDVSNDAPWEKDRCWNDPGPETAGECKLWETRPCPPDVLAGTHGTSGGPADYCMQRCVNIGGKMIWGSTTTNAQCPFYDTPWHRDAGPECVCAADTSTQSSSTPLVLSFDDQPVTFTTLASGSFDLTRSGVCHASDWPTSVTPWLALDRNEDGVIDDGRELFGSATKLEAGGFAKNGFEALRELDTDHDGVLDARDATFSKIVVWADRNLDRQSTPDELTSLESAGVMSIDLRDHRDMRCDARGNCEGERSRFTFVAPTGEARRGTVIDVYLRTR
jgi:hypothetical protein